MTNLEASAPPFNDQVTVLSAENGNEAVACVYAALSSIERNGAGVKLSEVVEAASKK